MKIYVAGKWQEKEHIREVIYHLKSLGHDVAFDWTVQDDTSVTKELREQAVSDTNGVKNSDVVIVVLINEDQYLSMSPNRYVEVGIAIGAGVPTWIVGEPREDFLFRHHPLVRVFKKIENLPL